MEKVINVALMQQCESTFIDNNLQTSISLMDKAALGVFNNATFKGKIAIVCGKGNNGGDGFALASYLLNANKIVDVIIFDNTLTNTSRHFYDLLVKRNVKIITYSSDFSFKGYDTIVDCIFGIGFKGDVKGVYKEAIIKINGSGAYVISVDINSGLNANTGISKMAVKSNITIAINNYKPGHFLNMAKDLIDELKVVDIGIPTISNAYLFDENKAKSLLEDRLNYSNKGSYGRVAIIGGSNNYPGAIKLAYLAQNALYSGAGLSKVIVPDIIANKLYPYVLEATIAKLPSNNDTFLFDKDKLNEVLKGINALAIGVGLSKSDDTLKMLDYILDNYDIPLVIDADGINNLVSLGVNKLNNTKCKVILTPHLMEFSRLTNISIEEINQRYLEIVDEFVNKYNVTLLLKGPTTIIANKDNMYYVNTGCPGMASAGSGDVLTGILAGLLGYIKKDNLEVTALAAYINGLAGEIASEEYGDISMVASDTARNVSKVIFKLKKES